MEKSTVSFEFDTLSQLALSLGADTQVLIDAAVNAADTLQLDIVVDSPEAVLTAFGCYSYAVVAFALAFEEESEEGTLPLFFSARVLMQGFLGSLAPVTMCDLAKGLTTLKQ